jgi:hypothetical protein
MKSALAITGALLVMAVAGSAGAQTGSTTGSNDVSPSTTSNTTTTGTTDTQGNVGSTRTQTDAEMNTSGANDANTMNDNTTTGQSLPSTASPLPLLYVSAIGTLTTGYWLARRRRG